MNPAKSYTEEEVMQNRINLISAMRSEKYELGQFIMRKVEKRTLGVTKYYWCVSGVMCEEYRLYNEESSYWMLHGYVVSEFNALSEKYGKENNFIVSTIFCYGFLWNRENNHGSNYAL